MPQRPARIDDVIALADYAIQRHDPDLAGQPDRYELFLGRVITRQAKLIADWQLVGFIHGVMNTDNTFISGEGLDYGPCAFMDTYHPNTVFSSNRPRGTLRLCEPTVYRVVELGPPCRNAVAAPR